MHGLFPAATSLTHHGEVAVFSPFFSHRPPGRLVWWCCGVLPARSHPLPHTRCGGADVVWVETVCPVTAATPGPRAWGPQRLFFAVTVLRRGHRQTPPGRTLFRPAVSSPCPPAGGTGLMHPFDRQHHPGAGCHPSGRGEPEKGIRVPRCLSAPSVPCSRQPPVLL